MSGYLRIVVKQRNFNIESCKIVAYLKFVLGLVIYFNVAFYLLCLVEGKSRLCY